jgi:hypothetical protein
LEIQIVWHNILLLNLNFQTWTLIVLYNCNKTMLIGAQIPLMFLEKRTWFSAFVCSGSILQGTSYTGRRARRREPKCCPTASCSVPRPHPSLMNWPRQTQYQYAAINRSGTPSVYQWRGRLLLTLQSFAQLSCFFVISFKLLFIC